MICPSLAISTRTPRTPYIVRSSSASVRVARISPSFIYGLCAGWLDMAMSLGTSKIVVHPREPPTIGATRRKASWHWNPDVLGRNPETM